MAEHYSIAIVGSGPAGLSAAARAAKRGISHIVLERTGQIADTVRKYQKRKGVMATPPRLPVRSDIGFEEGLREQVLETWEVDTSNIDGVTIRLNAEVKAISGQKGDFRLTLASGDIVEADHVVLAIGLQGNLRRLDIPGAEWERVQYQLDDADAYNDENIIVVGGGDAGIENALALSDNNNVTIINNLPEFSYAKVANSNAIKAKIDQGEIQAFMAAKTKRIAPGLLTVDTAHGEVHLACDRIIARIGALPPRKFLESCGIAFASPAPTAFPTVSDTYESSVPGLYIVGALAGYPLIKQCLNQGYEVVEYIRGNLIAPADEPIIQRNMKDLDNPLSVNELVTLVRSRGPFQALTTLQVREMLLKSKVWRKKQGEVVFRVNEYSNSLWLVLHGAVDIHIDPNDPNVTARLGPGQFFGEMGLISGRRRTATVTTKIDSLLLEVAPNHMIRLKNTVPEIARAIDEVAILRQLKMYLRTQIHESSLRDIVASAQIVGYKPNEVLIQEGASDKAVYLIRSGSVMMSRRHRDQDVVFAYRGPGHYVGEMALMLDQPRSATVKAAVATEAIKLDGAAFRALIDRDPEVRREVERNVAGRLDGISAVAKLTNELGVVGFMVNQGLTGATDVLLIDESLCVRCDNCEKACAETHHGVSRLDREAGPTFGTLHVPTSCRHCEHPHCMKDCPPDAIQRDEQGEVYIMDTCIGCGNCERNCPYGVIQMAATPAEKPSLFSWLFFGRGPGPGEDKSLDGLAGRTGSVHAVKCDMCKGQDAGPACVRACPTGAAIRVEPAGYLKAIGLELSV